MFIVTARGEAIRQSRALQAARAAKLGPIYIYIYIYAHATGITFLVTATVAAFCMDAHI